MTYTMAIEPLTEIYPELEPICREHYAEMTARLEGLGLEVSPYYPRLDEYFKASKSGYLLTFVLRHEGKIVGYSNIYVTNDMHNHDKICSEDVLFVTKAHRGGIGRKFAQYGLAEMKKRGVKSLNVLALTDLRVAKLWKRMGFKEVGIKMIYTF